ncbi:hypothetical protein K443DRAFT_9740 [Laccaria amethystina LaAM-08-1]|uniref:Nephrocystin 3-like N-terminal domain-containing protein n=1 Tax=Laccaria amethystina LaAM-08-1 TaxID=1095629 RepID=A0A0C9XJ89_9AGAR|nr:hypothetical protein K443DRAFT_9740 [Laccaria amethystina LaAM-08-1]
MAVLKDISDWISDRSRESRILWLTAPAGSGKSAILQEIAEMFDESGGLAASFFFSRMADKRNKETHFIATIAFQFAISIPSARPFIEQAIRMDPSLFDKVMLSQMQHLVVEPLVRASLHPENGSPWPSLLVIDGLDECMGATAQRDILLVLKDALRRLEVSLPRLCVLIASRPEPAICEVFTEGLSSMTYHLVLDSHYKPDDDIALYLQSSFSDIYRRRHKYFPSMSSLAQPWPSKDIISFLVKKSSGQFIFAATVVRFVGADRKVPTAQLQIVMDICKSVNSSHHLSNPFVLLDELYAHVLCLSEDLERVLTYLGAIFHLSGSQTLSCDFLYPLLGLSREDLSLLFWDLHSIIHVPVSNTDQLHFHHASFSDFLMDKHRSGTLHIDEFKAHLYLLESCIRNICDALNTNPSSFEDGKLCALQYSLSFWSYHFVCANCIMNNIHPGKWKWSPDDSDISNLAKWWNFFAPACSSWLHHSAGLSLAPHSKVVDLPNNHGYLLNHKGLDKLILQLNGIIKQLIPISNGSTVNEANEHLVVPNLLKVTQDVEKQIVIYTGVDKAMKKLNRSIKIAFTLTPATTCKSGDQWDTIIWKICYFEKTTTMQYKINWTSQYVILAKWVFAESMS